MPKDKRIYICSACLYESYQWAGQCPSCGEWNTFNEGIKVTESKKSLAGSSRSSASLSHPINMSKVDTKTFKRASSGIAEFDRVLGGGFVPGQVVILTGEPGIGKSTLLTQLSNTMKNQNILYVCGEESPEQIKLRANRLGFKGDNLFLLNESNVHASLAELEEKEGDKNKYGIAIIDSIQTIYSPDFSGITGSMPQVRGCTHLLTNLAKKTNTPLILVGHVTKQGVVAGPKILEHIVDTVLQLEGDSQHMFRVLRTTKNRFGPISEVGIFEMGEKGMEEVKNPSELFLEHYIDSSPGSSVTVVMEGQRPLLFEIQALAVSTSFGYPKRTTSGYSNSRLQVLLATLEKRAGVKVSNDDIYLNVAGGFNVKENAADLSVCISVASAIKNKPVKKGTVAFGEVGLNGEVRRVPQQSRRAKEAKNLGYTNIISPSNVKNIRQAIKKALID